MNPTILAAPPMLETPQGSIPLRYSIEQVPEDSDGQVAATIAKMCGYVCEDYKTPQIIYDAQCALACDPSNSLSATHTFVRNRLKFRNDEAITQPFDWMLPKQGQQGDYFVECLKRPVDVSNEFAMTGVPVEGDCDDYSMYCAALLKAMGIDCCFATVGANKEHPEVYSHVYTVAYFRGQRYPMDCSHGPYAGWEVYPPNCGVKFAEWAVFDRTSYAWVGAGIAALAFLAWKNRETIRGFFA